MIGVRPPRETTATVHTLKIRPESVKTARDFVTYTLIQVAATDVDHIDTVRIVTSELVTNAIKYGAAGQSTGINIEISVWPKWTIITVDDRDPHVYPQIVTDDRDGLPESGRGLVLVKALSAQFWWHHRNFSKTANAVVLRSNMTLRRRDHAILRRLENPDE